jgi:DMSO/TMAO reductase YedYZ molybdopterin-dependent catalytic subunit
MAPLLDMKIPVFWAEGQPAIRREGYLLRVGGLVEGPRAFDLAVLAGLATDCVSCRLTSVTRWSVRLQWKGILTRRLADIVRPLPAASFVRFTSYGGLYTTTVPLSAIDHPRAIVAVSADGEDLPVEYGGPVRAVFPQLWGYKSAKSIVAVDFLDHDEDGYWEVRGYPGDAAISATKLFDINARATRHHPGGEVTW